MKKFNLTISATIVATIVLSMFAFQTVTTEASSNASPIATPSPRTKRPAVNVNANVKIKKPRVNSAINGDDDWVRRSKQKRGKRKN
jgi:hypothetical protein